MKEKEEIMVICKANFHILTQLTKSWWDFNPCHSFISARTAIISERMSGDHVSRARLMLTCSSFANLWEEKNWEITSRTKIDCGGAENCESNGCVCQLKANWLIFILTHVLVCKFYSLCKKKDKFNNVIEIAPLSCNGVLPHFASKHSRWHLSRSFHRPICIPLTTKQSIMRLQYRPPVTVAVSTCMRHISLPLFLWLVLHDVVTLLPIHVSFFRTHITRCGPVRSGRRGGASRQLKAALWLSVDWTG